MDSASGSTEWECARSSTNGRDQGKVCNAFPTKLGALLPDSQNSENIYGETDLEELAREVDLRLARQTDAGKLAREIDLSSARDDGLVPDQKERRHDVLAA
jgi:hypothetical protein